MTGLRRFRSRTAARLRQWTEYSRAKALGVGLVLLAVPTAFEIFPALARLPWIARGAIGLVWLATAVATVAGTRLQEEHVASLTDDRRAHRHALRLAALQDVLAALLRRGTKGIPESFEFTLYVHDSETETLVPWWPPWDEREGADLRTFKAGDGATGSAWHHRRTFAVTGDAVANGKYGLTAEQQEFFAGYRTVVATPIWEDGVRRFGVLSAISPHETDHFDDPAGSGQAALRELADTLGVVVRTIPFQADIEFLLQRKGAVSQ